ncbi:hypothetical protein [Celeribacter sp. PS-C1]|uniref:hypothetical protein n=1 Tax=Celeribacter sp. PS-C1 TaxID=2820813 RepID=UPI001CA57EF9|nr:hypothetical protein [Celeribacter sp. PS-C1]MBW6419791.1 hypothetical protein [Celeribacter sp. PS-C1]
MFDVDHPFFRPLATRITIVAICFGWGVLETFKGSDAFALLFFGLSAYTAYRFWIAPRRHTDAEPTENDTSSHTSNQGD